MVFRQGIEMNSFKGSLLVLLGALCFSLSGTLQGFAPQEANPFTVTESRMVLGAVLLFLWSWHRNILPASWKAIRWKAVLFMAICLYAFQLLFFTSVLKVGVAVGTVAAIGSTPIWTAVLEKLLYGRNPPWIWYVATIMAIAGIILLNADYFSSTSNLLYVAFSLLAGLCYAGEIIISPKTMEESSPEASMMLVMAAVALLNAPSLFSNPLGWLFTLEGMATALGLGFVTAALAFALFFSGIRLVSPALASTLSLAEPMGAAAWGIFILNESASWTVLSGIALIIVSIVLIITKGKTV